MPEPIPELRGLVSEHAQACYCVSPFQQTSRVVQRPVLYLQLDRLSVCPASRAVGLGGSGGIYVGVNLEFPGAPLSNSVCLGCVPFSSRIQYVLLNRLASTSAGPGARLSNCGC
jgi:hypothetical protein